MATTTGGRRKGGGGEPPSDSAFSGKRRKCGRFYSLEDKEKIILMMEQGWRNSDIQRATGTPESTIRTFKKKKEDLKKSIAVAKRYSSDNTGASKVFKGITDRRHVITVTEHLLLNWAKRHLREEGTLDNSSIQSKASALYENVCRRAAIKNSLPFPASKNWLAKFKQRCGMNMPMPMPDAKDSLADKPVAVLTVRKTPHLNIKVEPTSPENDDPLAILPEEERKLRSVSGPELIPRVVIPILNQSLIRSLSTGAHISIVDSELDASTSDSEAAVSISGLDVNDGSYECDFAGFEDGSIKVESEDLSAEGSPPLHPEALTPQQPAALPSPPQLEDIALSSRTPNSEPTVHEDSCYEQGHNTTTPRQAQPKKARQTASSLPTLHEDSRPEQQRRKSSPWHTRSKEAKQTTNSVPTLHEACRREQQHRTPTSWQALSEKAKKTDNSVTAFHESSPPDSLQRASTPWPIESNEAGQTDTGCSQPPCVTRVEPLQAVNSELQRKRKEETDVNAKLAVVKLENERIRQEILKEVLMQNKIETAIKRKKAMMNGIDISSIMDAV